MAIPIAKLTILIGAGLVGHALANKEGGLSDFVSGAFKIVYRQIQRKDDTSPTIKKPENSSLLAQVNSLREELQRLDMNRSVVVIEGERRGRSTFGAPVVVVVIVVGYGYLWWKGWKLSDMMFATRRSLSDARASVAKQLEQVNSSVTAAKRQLSSRIERVDSNIEECKELTSETRSEVFKLQGETRKFTTNVETVHLAVKNLESKIGEIEGKQDMTNRGVERLCDFAKTIENGRTASIQASPSTSSRPALEPPPVIHTSSVLSKTRSLQQERKSLEPPSPSVQVLTKTSSMQPGLVFVEPPSPSIQVLTKTSSLQPELVFMEPPSPSIQVSSSTSQALLRPRITPTSRTSSMPTESPAPSSKNDTSSSSGRFGWFFGGAR